MRKRAARDFVLEIIVATLRRRSKKFETTWNRSEFKDKDRKSIQEACKYWAEKLGKNVKVTE